MTEIERIKSEGWIPETFFEEEVIDEFVVTENMKKVWAIEMDLYKHFEHVCHKNDLEFWTDGGTTLGAIRHKGFIPWDDDFDVCMPREAYEKLKLLSSEFEVPYFLQSAETDPEYGFSFMRLCNSNTTVVVDKFLNCNFKKGISIDIFPIDKVTPEDYITRREKINRLIMTNSAYMRYNTPNKTDRDVEMITAYYNEKYSPLDVWLEIEKIATLDQNIDTDYLSLIVSTQYAPEKKIWPKHIFDGYEIKPFECIEVRVPKGYDEQLSIYYGDYMKFPPVESRGAWHHAKYYPDIPFSQYFSELC